MAVAGGFLLIALSEDGIERGDGEVAAGGEGLG